jgi:hypothetical protein
MQLVQAADASRLAGLTSHQLREWCSRRAILLPDTPGGGRGRHALFSWQTVLTLRLLRELHERFGAEVGAWSEALEECRNLLKGRPFPALWSTYVVFPDRCHAQLVTDLALHEGALLVLPLELHLHAIAGDFSFPVQGQLPLLQSVERRR